MKSFSDNLRRDNAFRAGLTLIEMVVSVALLVVVILGVGVIFKSSSDMVGTSERTLDVLSNVRSIQSQIAQDVAGIDKDGFLVIRSATYPFTDSSGYNGPHRCDLVSFISYGSFHHRTGSTGGNGNVFTDNNTFSPSAFITLGQLAMEKISVPSGSDYIGSDQSFQLPLTQTPTGIISTPTGFNDGGMTLGRTAILLSPKSITTSNNDVAGLLYTPAFQPVTTSPPRAAIDFSSVNVSANSTFDNGVAANITQSRVDLAATTPGQIMSILEQAVGTNRSSSPRYEADHFCYRHGALASMYDGQNIVNGYFRMTPIALQGVTSFSVEWSDGSSVYPAGTTDPTTGTDISGTTEWFGSGNPKHTAWSAGNPSETGANSASNDIYAVVFSYDTYRTNWPAALRFRYHVADSTGRLRGGRDFTQVVKLPK